MSKPLIAFNNHLQSHSMSDQVLDRKSYELIFSPHSSNVIAFKVI